MSTFLHHQLMGSAQYIVKEGERLRMVVICESKKGRGTTAEVHVITQEKQSLSDAK